MQLIYLTTVLVAILHLSKAALNYGNHHQTTLDVPSSITSKLDNMQVCDYLGTYIACNGFKSNFKMHLVSHKVEMLSATDNDITVLEGRTMRRRRKLKFLNITNNFVASFRRVFRHNTDLTWLIADNNRLGVGHKMELTGVFKYNRKLQLLSMNGNMIRFIPDNMFGASNDLSYLSLADNNIARIYQETFANLHKLTKLDLHSNKITYVDSQAFRSNKKLTELDLCGNLIMFTGENQPLDLTENKHLKILEMSSNKMTSISELDLSGNQALRRLDLSFNQIGSLDSQALRNNFQLYCFNASYNFINRVDPQAFQSLRNLHSLDLSHNRITTITRSTLTNLRNLQLFSLAYNKLTHLPEDLFYGNGRLVALDLRGNQLTTWQPNTIYSNVNLKFLDLRDNEFEVENIDYFTESLNQKNEFDIGDWASDSHVGDGETPETILKHQSLSKKVFNRILCLRLSGNPLAGQAHSAVVERRVTFWAGKNNCEVRNHGERIFRCGCNDGKLAYSLHRWVAHEERIY